MKAGRDSRRCWRRPRGHAGRAPRPRGDEPVRHRHARSSGGGMAASAGRSGPSSCGSRCTRRSSTRASPIPSAPPRRTARRRGCCSSLSFAYGIFHAAGPGHGKAVIIVLSARLGRDGAARRRHLVRLGHGPGAASRWSSSASRAIVLHVTAQKMTVATDWLEIGSYSADRGGRRVAPVVEDHGGGHHHHHHHFVPGRPRSRRATITSMATSMRTTTRARHGHAMHMLTTPCACRCPRAEAPRRHEPRARAFRRSRRPRSSRPRRIMRTPGAVASGCLIVATRALVNALSTVLAVGIRPCSGAIIILVFALSQGLFAAGVAATFVMAIGTGRHRRGPRHARGLGQGAGDAGRRRRLGEGAEADEGRRDRRCRGGPALRPRPPRRRAATGLPS